MKSPEDVRQILSRQWESADHRAKRLLGGNDAWPVEISIGLPSAEQLRSRLGDVQRHVQRWRDVSIGEVSWTERAYRSTAGAISLPQHWRLLRPTDWIAACRSATIRAQFAALSAIIGAADPIFHEVLVRRRSLWREQPTEEVIHAAKVALRLQPGIAAGRPLRLLSIEGSDTKFFERHERLLTTLLDQRYDGEPSRLGLAAFLGALSEADHWVLVLDLDGALLPFEKQRVRCSELAATALPAGTVLIVENETCAHLLPRLPDTIAVLGSGFDLGWTAADWLNKKRVGYWGDIDTWGLSFLAQARANVPHLVDLLMDRETLDQHAESAVREPVPADSDPPAGLLPNEAELYNYLLTQELGRLEQEFVAADRVRQAVAEFAMTAKGHE